VVDALDPEAVPLAHGSLFSPGRRCVAGPTVDALVSCLILHRALGWQIVGFYTSSGLYLGRDALKGPAPTDVERRVRDAQLVFVGLSVWRRGVFSMSTDVIRWSHDLPRGLADRAGLLLNPNAICGVTGAGLAGRFPLSLTGFLLGCLPKHGGSAAVVPSARLQALMWYLGGALQKAARRPGGLGRWDRWLPASAGVKVLGPSAREENRTYLAGLLNTFSAFSCRLRSLGISPYSQRLRLSTASDWTSLEHLVTWLKALVGVPVGCDPLLMGPLVAFRVHAATSTASRRSFAGMIARNPFAYAIVGRGPRGLRYSVLGRPDPSLAAVSPLPFSTTATRP